MVWGMKCPEVWLSTDCQSFYLIFYQSPRPTLPSRHLTHSLQDQLDSVPAESRRRSRKGKFQGVPGIAGRDFPTLGSIPMTRSHFFATLAVFYWPITLFQFLMHRYQGRLLRWLGNKLSGNLVYDYLQYLLRTSPLSCQTNIEQGQLLMWDYFD